MLWIDKHETQFFPNLRFVIDVTLASGVTFTSGEGLLDAESVEEAEAAKQLRGGEMLPEDWPVVSSIVRMPPDSLLSESAVARAARTPMTPASCPTSWDWRPSS